MFALVTNICIMASILQPSVLAVNPTPMVLVKKIECHGSLAAHYSTLEECQKNVKESQACTEVMQ